MNLDAIAIQNDAGASFEVAIKEQRYIVERWKSANEEVCTSVKTIKNRRQCAQILKF